MDAFHSPDLSVTAAPGLVDRMFQGIFYLAYRLHLGCGSLSGVAGKFC
jgi:hypothetical protein